MDSGKGRLIVWIILVLALVSMLAFVYSGSLGIGFLLDDFYHIDYLTRAFNGDNSELMNTLFGSMSGPTGLTSFRPILSLGFCLDYLIWGVNASGYHLTNLILFGGCCVFLALITNELCKFNSSSIVVCGLAVLLFIFYPLHP
ncbi:MAG: hypothetical protein K8F91_24280, partial [Candidatus Obscuribacterales bacterium]|nr:hypothetical protein [Candidatus Obscuribacterales bacterium]